jgi:hypothetical protein
VSPSKSYIAVFGRSPHGRREPLLVDALTAEILRLCNGTRNILDICNTIGPKAGGSAEETVAWIENLFVLGLVSLRDGTIIASHDLIQAT